jgi:hypothetical protein
LQPFRNLKSLLALSCVVLICAAEGRATSAKKPLEEKAASKAEHKHGETVAKPVSKLGTPANTHSSPEPQVGSTSKSHSSRSTMARPKNSKRRVSSPVKRRGQQGIQSDNGWQTKVVPDSRALIKLGLGPKHANLTNPEAAAGSGLLPEGTRDLHPGGSPPNE